MFKWLQLCNCIYNHQISFYNLFMMAYYAYWRVQTFLWPHIARTVFILSKTLKGIQKSNLLPYLYFIYIYQYTKLVKYKIQWYSHVMWTTKILDMSGQYDDIFRCRLEIAFIFSNDHFIWVKLPVLMSLWYEIYQYTRLVKYEIRWYGHVRCVAKNHWHVLSVWWYILMQN